VSVHGQAVAGSGGIVCGAIQKLDSQDQIIPEYGISKAQHTAEKKRFVDAITQASRHIQKEMDALREHPQAKVLLPILETHLMMLSDPELRESTQRYIEEKSINVEWALKRCMADFVQAFADMDDVYLKSRKADIEQVGKRILHELTDKTNIKGSVPAIIVAQDFSPSDIVSLWRMGAIGFVAAQGGKEGHALIVARGLGLTGLIGAQGLFAQASDGDELILDAEHLCWTLRPSQQERDDFKKKQAQLAAEQDALKAFAHTPSRSKDGYALPLLANIEFIEEIDIALEYGVDGIGLFRTEFLFMQSDTLPSEDEQTAYYQAIVQRVGNLPVTFRLLDVGADKLAYAQLLFDDYDGENPALGLRGVRMLLHKPKLLRTQLRAILRSSPSEQVSILVPMVTSVSEMQAVRTVVEEIQAELKINHAVSLGCMIEVPSAALIAHDLANVSDFFSIGSNDLVQYTLAVDRADEHVSYLYDANHPAVRQLIQMAVDAAQARHIPITICGELAADTTWTQTFLDMRISALSMTSRNILHVRKRLQELQAKTSIIS